MVTHTRFDSGRNLVIREDTMDDDKAKELAEAVKLWWKDHKYDTTGDYGEYNVYDDEPAFVAKAKEIIGDWEQSD